MRNKFLLILIASFSIVADFPARAQPTQPVILQPGATITLPTGSSPCAVAVADFNADNRADVAVCEQALNQVGVFLQTVAATFPNQSGTYPAGISPSGLMAVRLTNNTNRPSADLVALSSPSSKWTMLMNDGNGQGTFTELTGVRGFGTNVPSTNPQLVAGYINRDNYIDFAYTYPAPAQNRVKWDAYAGAGQFSNTSYFEPFVAPSSLALDDFDRDGYTDVTFTNTAGNEVWVVYAGVGSNGSPLWGGSSFVQLASVGQQPVDVATGDVNYDFRPDLAVACAGSSFATVFLNTGGPNQFSSPSTYPLSAPARKVLFADLNGDTYPELLAVTADNKLQVFQHTGAPGSTRYGTPLVLATGVNPTTLQAVDMNGDFVKDIVVGCTGDNTVRIYLNRTLMQPTATHVAKLAGISVCPNPAVGQLFVRSASETKGPLAATLIDALGRTVREQEVQPNTTAIPVADLPRGLYTLRLIGKEGISTTK